MDAASNKTPEVGKPGSIFEKVPEAGTVIPGLIQAAVILIPGIPGPLRVVFLILITIIAVGYGLHLANLSRTQTPLTIVACTTLATFSFVAVFSVSAKEWGGLMQRVTCAMQSCGHSPPKKYFVSIHIFRDEDGDNIQGAFDKDIPNARVILSYVVEEKSYDVSGYTNNRGMFNQALDGPHVITVKVCGITKDDDGAEPLQLTSANDDPALTLPVKIGVRGEQYRECVHQPAS